MNIMEIFGKRMVFFDGGMGTMLQDKGLQAGELPELWNIEHKEELIAIHKSYCEAGCDILTTNTFGANSLKFAHGENTTCEIVTAAVKNAKAAINQENAHLSFVALDIGPTGKLLKPFGDLPFEKAYELYKEVVLAGDKAGADLVLIETMSDTFEAKAAILAAKENSALPVFVTMVFDENGKLLTGGNVQATVAMLEGLGVDAIGVNCGLGPHQMKKIMGEFVKYSSTPIIINPNAGLPKNVGGKTVYDINPAEFAQAMREICAMGAWAVGGCCGTTPAHISAMIALCKDITPTPIDKKHTTVVSSYARVVEIGRDPIIIGERINPTGKSRFKQALRDKNIDYILREGLTQQQMGAHVLDVNVGLPDINEAEMMELVVGQLQSVIDLPLQIDTTDLVAMERAMRSYNGKPLINSVNGKRESMERVFPLIKRYGGVVVALALDESGIPETSEGRFAIAEKIINTAKEYGIDKNDIIIDVLAMTISSEGNGAVTTLKALKMVREQLGVNTVLGVSNISFGLPKREFVNASFYALALQNGLTAAIINPCSEAMMGVYQAYRALAGIDDKCMDYINAYSGEDKQQPTAQTSGDLTLSQAIEKGLKELSSTLTTELLTTIPPLTIISTELIPALDKVGKGFEKGTVFLPQLLISAESAKTAFDAIKIHMERSGEKQVKKGKIILATVKGDIHDIGKNIVKVLLENYGFDVIDLGKDVDPIVVVDTALAQDVHLIGLSALMTTTVTSMEQTIQLLRQCHPSCKVMVGGAVLTQEYADMIGADFYGKDAMASVYYAKKVLDRC